MAASFSVHMSLYIFPHTLRLLLFLPDELSDCGVFFFFVYVFVFRFSLFSFDLIKLIAHLFLFLFFYVAVLAIIYIFFPDVRCTSLFHFFFSPTITPLLNGL